MKKQQQRLASFGLASSIVLVLALAGPAGAITTGGYSAAATDDAEVQAAAAFAVEAQSKAEGASLALNSVLQAESQVVAGINYKLCLGVQEGEQSAEASVVVYRNLQKEYSLTSWSSGNCSGKSEEGKAESQEEKGESQEEKSDGKEEQGGEDGDD